MADGKVVYIITGDNSEFNKAVKDTEKTASSAWEKIKAGGSAAFKAVGVSVAAVGTAVVAAAAGFVKGTGAVAEYGDNIDKMSQKLGMSTDAYQEWDAVLKHSGANIEAMQSSMKTLASAAETDSKAFEKLGISQEKIVKMSQEELFEETITALQNVEDETERTYLAGKLLGRGATELGALLNTSAEETQAMRDRVHELGGVMSEDGVKAAAHYQDSLQDLETAFGGIKRGLVSDFLPSVTTVMDGLTELFSGDSENGLEMISSGINDLITDLTGKLPEFSEIAGEIITSISTALVSNLPLIFEAGAQIIIQLTQSLAAQLPDVVSTGLEILKTLVTTLIQAAPDLVSAAVELVTSLCDFISNNIDWVIDTTIDLFMAILNALIENAPRLIEAGIELVVKLIAGLIQSIPDVLSAVWEIVTAMFEKFLSAREEMREKGKELLQKVIDGIKDKISDILSAVRDVIDRAKTAIHNKISEFREIGRNLLAGLVEGIKAKVQDVIDAVGGAVRGAIQWAKNLLGVASPSKVFKVIGQYTDEGLAEGIKSFADMPVKAVKKMVTTVVDNGNMALPTGQLALQTGFGSIMNSPIGFTISKLADVLNVRSDSDIDAISEALYTRIVSEKRGRGLY